jgi:hypothetical protein
MPSSGEEAFEIAEPNSDPLVLKSIPGSPSEVVLPPKRGPTPAFAATVPGVVSRATKEATALVVGTAGRVLEMP